MGERTLLSHSFLAGYNARIIKREAGAQLFIIDPIIGLDLFLSDPPPLRKLLHWPAAVTSRWLISVIIIAPSAPANKKRAKFAVFGRRLNSYQESGFFALKKRLFKLKLPKSMPIQCIGIICRRAS
jgi:hypothetical protein